MGSATTQKWVRAPISTLCVNVSRHIHMAEGISGQFVIIVRTFSPLIKSDRQ
jgi:hypothetical protein